MDKYISKQYTTIERHGKNKLEENPNTTNCDLAVISHFFAIGLWSTETVVFIL